LSAPPVFPSLAPAIPPHQVGSCAHVGILGAYPTTPGALATFSTALSDALRAHGVDVSVVQEPSVAECIDLLDQSDVAVLHSDQSMYGSGDGEDVVGIIDGLRVPSIVIAHSLLKAPGPQQRSMLESITGAADHVVVMSETARQRLCSDYHVDRRKVTMIPHGALVPTERSPKRPSRPTVLTSGLLGPGKGIERVIEAMGSLKDLPGRPRYLVAGPTHPKVLAADGEAYREARIEQARRGGVTDSVSLDGRSWNAPLLSTLAQSAAVVVLPYDSTDQVTSGALVGAIASGRPVVATAFPHAVELLCGGAGVVVDHDDPGALVAALRSILTQPRLAGSMAAEARRLAPQMAWPTVAAAYLHLAQRLVAERGAVK
jgi:glycosyltransferase involved in cell wall biosynthesis